MIINAHIKKDKIYKLQFQHLKIQVSVIKAKQEKEFELVTFNLNIKVRAPVGLVIKPLYC